MFSMCMKYLALQCVYLDHCCNSHYFHLQAGTGTPKSPSTDIFDMVPFSPVSHVTSTPARNGTQPPPVPSRATEISKLSKQINILSYVCVQFRCFIDTLWKITYLKFTQSVNYQRIIFHCARSANHI